MLPRLLPWLANHRSCAETSALLSVVFPSLCRPRRPPSKAGVESRSKGTCECDRCHAALPPGVVKPPRGCDIARGPGELERGARSNPSSRSRHSSASAKTARSGRCVRIWSSVLIAKYCYGTHPCCSHELATKSVQSIFGDSSRDVVRDLEWVLFISNTSDSSDCNPKLTSIQNLFRSRAISFIPPTSI
jgi:hypothetical protein